MAETCPHEVKSMCFIRLAFCCTHQEQMMKKEDQTELMNNVKWFSTHLSYLHLFLGCLYITYPQAEKVHKRLTKIKFKMSYCKKHLKNCLVFYIKILLHAHRNAQSSKPCTLNHALWPCTSEIKGIRGYKAIYLWIHHVSGFFFFVLFFSLFVRDWAGFLERQIFVTMPWGLNNDVEGEKLGQPA